MPVGRKYIYIGIFLLLIIILTIVMFAKLINHKNPILSPLTDSNFWPFAKSRQLNVTGFLPYWNVKDDLNIDFDALDTLVYFNLLVDENGKILHSTNGEMEPGWRNFQSQKIQDILNFAKKKKKKVGISIAAFDEEVLLGVTADIEKQETLIAEIIDLIDNYKFNHINIDFEYFPENEDKEFGQKYNLFLDKLRKAIKRKNENIILSVDIYAKAIIKDSPYKIREMNALADEVIFMAYDFHNVLSETTGPVAPLKSDDSQEYSIVQALSVYLSKVGANKLVLGIPLYGYEWLTVDNTPRSATVARTGQTASYKRVKALIADKELTVNWDATASSPWINFTDEDDESHQIYFENMESWALKIQLAQQLKLPGIAFWALGYEGDNRELWEYIKGLD